MRRLSGWKVLLAFFTCGISILFVGITSGRSSNMRADTKKKIAQFILVWIVSAIPFYLIAQLIFPVDGNGKLQIPDAYSTIMVFISLLCAILFLNAEKLKSFLGKDQQREEDAWRNERRSSDGAPPARRNYGSCSMPRVDSMSGHEFEYFVADLLQRLSYQDVEVTRGSGDQVVDVLAAKDGVRYAIQCKCYSSDLGKSLFKISRHTV